MRSTNSSGQRCYQVTGCYVSGSTSGAFLNDHVPFLVVQQHVNSGCLDVRCDGIKSRKNAVNTVTANVSGAGLRNQDFAWEFWFCLLDRMWPLMPIGLLTCLKVSKTIHLTEARSECNTNSHLALLIGLT